MKSELLGIYWMGNSEKREPCYKMTRISQIVNTLNETNGDSKKAAIIINYDADPDDAALISSAEIEKIADLVSNNKIKI